MGRRGGLDLQGERGFGPQFAGNRDERDRHIFEDTMPRGNPSSCRTPSFLRGARDEEDTTKVVDHGATLGAWR